MWGILAKVLTFVFGGIFQWLIGKIIVLFGISFVTYKGVKPLYDNLTNQIKSYLNLTSPDSFPLVEWLGVMRVDVCLSILISAIGLKLILTGLGAAGGVTKMRVGG